MCHISGQHIHTVQRRERTYITVIIGMMIALVCELFVFNLPYWQTRYANPHDATDIVLGSGLKRQKGDYVVKDIGGAYLEIHGDEPIGYIRVNFNETPSANTLFHISLTTQQIGTNGWYKTDAVKRMSPAHEASTYMHVNNNAKNIRLEIKDGVGTKLPIRSVTINPRIGFSLNTVRLALMCMLALSLVLFRPSSSLYRTKLAPSLGIRSAQFWGIVAVTAIQVVWVVNIWTWAGGVDVANLWPAKHFGFTFDYDQYALLGDALIHGRTNLDLPVPESLAALSNPYDPDLRGELIVQGDGPIYWDHAFYNGRYYCYFGVVPALLLYVPYQLMTGHWLNTSVAVLGLGIAASLLAGVLVVRICRTYFDGTVSYGTVMLSVIIVNLGSSLYYQTFTPNFYAVPGVMSLTLTFAALSLWLAAKRRNLSKGLLAAGSFLMALNLGTRPQFILAATLALPIFWDELVRRQLFFSRKGVVNTIAALLPFAVVFAPLLWYNKARFGDWLDFGASYNLTGFDMVHMRFPIRNMLPLLYYFLIQPSNISGIFPFVENTSTPLPVWSAAEPSPGSVLALCPFLVLPIVALAVMQGERWVQVKRFVVGALAVALVVVMVDAATCGYAWRYYLDFSWLLCIAAVLIVQRMDRQTLVAQDDPRLDDHAVLTSIDAAGLFRIMMVTAIVASMLVQFFALFMLHRMTSMIRTRPELYFLFEQWFLPFS